MTKKIYGAAAAVLLAVGLGACAGDNWFTGPAGGGDGNETEVPVIVAVDVPDFVTPGGILDVEIEATGAEGIATIEVTLVEAVVRERTLTINPVRTDVSATTQFVLPDPLLRETVTVEVEVVDQRGGRSEAMLVEVPVVQDDDTLPSG